MSLWRRRRLDIRLAGEKLAAAEQKLIDLAVRRSRLEAEVELYIRQQGEGDKRGRVG